jgi:hypothetical protein
MDAFSVIAATVAVAMMAITVALFSADTPAGSMAKAGSAGAQHATTGR